jgi:hypothetical protein
MIEGRGDGKKSKLKRVLDDDITGLALSGKLRNSVNRRGIQIYVILYSTSGRIYTIYNLVPTYIRIDVYIKIYQNTC